MNHTKHVQTRCRQRGIPEDSLDLIMLYGKEETKPGGVIKYLVGRKEKQQMVAHLKHLIQEVDKLAGKSVIVADGSTVITAYHSKN